MTGAWDAQVAGVCGVGTNHGSKELGMMKAVILMLMCVTACAVESGADSSLAVEQQTATIGTGTEHEPSTASEKAMVDRASRALPSIIAAGDGTAQTNTLPPGCRSTSWPTDVGSRCCYSDSVSQCCCDLSPVFDIFTCRCTVLPHTDPGHGGIQDPFAPTAPVTGDEQ